MPLFGSLAQAGIQVCSDPQQVLHSTSKAPCAEFLFDYTFLLQSVRFIGQRFYPVSTQAWSPVEDLLYPLTLRNRPNLFSFERTLIWCDSAFSADLTSRNRKEGLRDESPLEWNSFCFLSKMSYSFIYRIFPIYDLFLGRVNRWKRKSTSPVFRSPMGWIKKSKSREKEWISYFLQLSPGHSAGQGHILKALC